MRYHSQNMNNILNKRVIAGALLSGGIAVAGLGLGSGTAQATAGPFTWCPGQSMDPPAGPNRQAFRDRGVVNDHEDVHVLIMPVVGPVR